MDFRRLPICLFGFNRPDYLRATVASLAQALAVGGMQGPVLLFLDGARSRFTGEWKTDPALIEACRQAFQALIPHGVVLPSAANLGIAGNIARGERWAFADNSYPAALFFEDDMVVSPRYFRVMAGLYELAQAQPRIAMFAAYGADGRASIAEQFAHRHNIGPMHHNWAFGLTRDAWATREMLTADYAAILDGCDYRDRPLERIAAWYGRLGWPPLPTSQDIAKSVALNTLGFARIASVAVCARNIGEVGQHYTPEQFRRLGLAEVQMLEGEHPHAEWRFTSVGEETVDAIVAEQRRELLRVRLAPEAFLASPDFIATLRTADRLAAAPLLRGGNGRFIAAAGGFYPDCWCCPAATLVFRPDVALRGVEIEAIAAQHLPPGATLALTLNGAPATLVALAAGEDVAVVVPMPRHLDGLEKTLELRCSVNLDPFSVGFNADRRALSVLLLRLTLLERDGTQTTLRGAEVLDLPA